jgi:hypothetical protein
MSQCVSLNFPGIFGIFRIFSVTLLIYLDISRFIFAQENISKKKKKKHPYLAGSSPWARPAPALAQPSARPKRIEARQSRRGMARPSPLGVCARHARASRRAL